MNATAVVRGALAGSGVELVASCGIEAYDAVAPEPLRSHVLAPRARGVVVVASAGTALWRAFLGQARGEPSLWDTEHPYDTFVASILARAEEALAHAGVAHRRFEPTLQSAPRLDFIALGRLTGLGSPGPFGMLVSREHGAWWALRGAWLVDADVEAPLAHDPPCAGCAAPCVGGDTRRAGILQATPETRARCPYGTASRYDHDQVAFHHDRARTVARLRSVRA